MNSIRSVNLQLRAMRTHRQERVRMLWGGRLFAHSGEDASCFSRSCRVRWTKARQGGPLWKKFGVSFVRWRQSFLGWAKGSGAHSGLTLLMLNKSLKYSLQSSKYAVFWVLFMLLSVIPTTDSWGEPQQIGGVVKPVPDSFDARPLIRDENWPLVYSEEINWGKIILCNSARAFFPPLSEVFFKVNLMLLNDHSSVICLFQDKAKKHATSEMLHSHQDE